MGMVLYLLLFAGFFAVMMRYGCGAHVMGHGQNGDQHIDGSGTSTGKGRSIESDSDFVLRTMEQQDA